MTYAIIENGKVINAIVWDGTTEYHVGEGKELVLMEHGGIGWDYIDGEFVDNRPVDEGLEAPEE